MFRLCVPRRLNRAAVSSPSPCCFAPPALASSSVASAPHFVKRSSRAGDFSHSACALSPAASATAATTITTITRRHFSSSSASALRPTMTLRAPADVGDDALAADIKEIIDSDRLVVFLTGTPEQPQCRFTVQMVDLLSQLGVKYSFFNILDDEEVCEGLKTYSEWPTYPQVYVDGELLGGFDICKKMMLDGSLVKLFKEKKFL